MKIIKKRKIREFDEIRLFETSAVGIPAYPFAHKSLSLVKSLADLFVKDEVCERLNKKELHKMVDENQSQNVEETSESEEKTESETSEPAKPEAESEPAKAEEEKAEEKSLKTSDAIVKAIIEGIAKGMSAIQTDRALVEKESEKANIVKDASTSELFASHVIRGVQ